MFNLIGNLSTSRIKKLSKLNIKLKYLKVIVKDAQGKKIVEQCEDLLGQLVTLEMWEKNMLKHQETNGDTIDESKIN